MADHRVDHGVTHESAGRLATRLSALMDRLSTAPFKRLKAPALGLVGLLLAATVLFWWLDIGARREPPYLNVILQITFVGLTSLFVAALAVRSFLRSGNWPVLWLGAGALVYSLATSLSAGLLQWVDVDAAVTTYSLSALLAASAHVMGVFFEANDLAPRQSRAGRRATAVQVYLASLAAITLITVSALRDVAPPFFVQGEGGTPWRQMTVVLAGLLFLFAGLSFLSRYRRSKADFLYWYALGLVLNALVMAGTLLTTATGSPLSWLVRVALAFSGLYFLVAVLITRAEARARSLAPSEVLASFFWRDQANVKLVFESIMDACIVTDQRSVITDWNQAAESLYGWQAAEVIGKPVSDVLSTTYVSDTNREQAHATLEQAGTWRGEVRQKHRDGTEIPILATVSALKDAAGRVVGTVALNHDITERVHSEHQLRQANVQILAQAEALRVARDELDLRVRERTAELSQREAVLEAIFASVPDALYVADASGIVRCNQAALDAFGCDSVEELNEVAAILAEKMHTRYADTGRPVPQAELAITRSLGGERVVHEVISRHLKTGQDYIYRRSAAPILLNGHTMGAVVISTDITKLKRSEEELRVGRERLQGMARRLVELQENERYEVANQLYNDEGQRLAALILGLAKLRKELPAAPAGDAALTELIHLADGVLSDIHSLAVTLRPASLDRLGLQAALNQTLTNLARQGDIEVCCELAALDPVHLAPEVETNTFRIVQEALANITRHARATSVSLTAARRDQQLIVVLEDDGVGFDVAAVERRGALGLLAMRERAEAMGGSLTVESALGSGTTLYIGVPAAYS